VAGSTTEDLHPYHVTLTMLLEDKTDNYTKKRIFVIPSWPVATSRGQPVHTRRPHFKTQEGMRDAPYSKGVPNQRVPHVWAVLQEGT
jgi:hypothetical protein